SQAEQSQRGPCGRSAGRVSSGDSMWACSGHVSGHRLVADAPALLTLSEWTEPLRGCVNTHNRAKHTHTHTHTHRHRHTHTNIYTSINVQTLRTTTHTHTHTDICTHTHENMCA